MNWYYSIQGDYVHVCVFMNGANCGRLTFRLDEFHQIRNKAEAFPSGIIMFFNETSA